MLPGPAPPAVRSADAIDQWFARLFAVIAALSWAGLLLAETGHFQPVPLFILAGVSAVLAFVLVERALRRHRAATTPRGAIFAACLLIVVAAASVLPPGDPVVAGADESVYLHLATALREHGTILSSDSLLDATPQDDWPQLFSRDRYWPQRLNRFEGGVQIAEGAPLLQPSFFHLLPIWIAGVEMAGGDRAGAFVAPAFAILGVVALFLAARRLTSSIAAAGAAALVATSLGQAWCGRQPLSELPAQYFVISGLLFFAAWTTERRSDFGALAGVAFGMAAFTRVDVLLLVTPVVIIVLAAHWWTHRAGNASVQRADRSPNTGLAAGAIALALVSGHALVYALTIAQPYTLRIGRHFVRDRTLPAFVIAALALTMIAVVLLVGRSRRWRIASLGRYLGPAIAVVTIALVLRQPSRLFESPLIYLLTGPGLVVAAVGLVRWSRREDTTAWLVLLLAAASAAAYLMPRDLPFMPNVFRRTLPVLLPIAALLLADTLVPRAASRLRALAGGLALVAIVTAGARHVVPLLGRPLPSGGRASLAAIARDVPASSVVIADRGLPSHLALALDFGLGRSALAADFILRDPVRDRLDALGRLMTRAAAANRDVFFLAFAAPSRVLEALPEGWTPHEVRSAPIEYSMLAPRRGAWPSEVQDVHQPITLYRLIPPQQHLSLPFRVDVGSLDLALSPTGWLPAETMLGTSGRWMTASAGLRLPAMTCESGASLFLRIRAATLRPAELIQPRVRLALNGTEIGEVTPADSAFRVYALELPLAAVPHVCTAPSTLSIETGTFVPARDAGSPDKRELGLAVDWVEVTPEAGRNLRE